MKQLLTAAILLLLISVSAANAQGSRPGPVKLEGQVVCCRDCWAKADRKTTPYGTRDDLDKAVECVGNGDPTLLAVANPQGEVTFYELQLGKYKRPGKNWLEYIGKLISVQGVTGKKKDSLFIKVDSLTVLGEPIAVTQPEVNVIGTEVDLTLKDLSGIEQQLSAYRGRVVVLNFWATYCVPCLKEMPDLAAIQNHYAALGVQVIGAAADTAADKQKVLQFIKSSKVNFPVWLGASAEDMQRFGLGSALPGTVVIGRDGKIAAKFRGIIKPAELKKQLDSLLATAEKESNQQVAATTTKPNKSSSVPS
ncbi:MAG TPA: TlpA disulfide reductase family protein [Blastocatellia bacterium]|nr:TlpA disulfide reductase family protein [Blastocatellia bacterium]